MKTRYKQLTDNYVNHSEISQKSRIIWKNTVPEEFRTDRAERRLSEECGDELVLAKFVHFLLAHSTMARSTNAARLGDVDRRMRTGTLPHVAFRNLHTAFTMELIN